MTNKLNIDFGEALTLIDLELVDISGRVIQKVHFSGTTYELNTELLNNGVYFLRLLDDGKTVTTKKIIVQH